MFVVRILHVLAFFVRARVGREEMTRARVCCEDLTRVRVGREEMTRACVCCEDLTRVRVGREEMTRVRRWSR